MEHGGQRGYSVRNREMNLIVGTRNGRRLGGEGQTGERGD